MSNSSSHSEPQLRHLAVAVAVAALGAGLVAAAALIRRHQSGAAEPEMVTIDRTPAKPVRIPVQAGSSSGPTTVPVTVKLAPRDRSVPKERWVPQLG